MKKRTILMFVMVAMTAMYAFAATNADYGDKASSQAAKGEILASMKAELGSEVPVITKLSLTRSRTSSARYGETEKGRLDDEDGDGGQDEDCTNNGNARVSDVLPPQTTDWYCIEDLCPGAIVRIDVDSHKDGAPTDIFLEVFEADCMDPLACRDDGNGHSGVTTDGCVTVAGPDSGKIWFSVSNISTKPCVDSDAGDCSYEANVTVRPVMEVENNNDTPQDWLFAPVDVVGDENGDIGEFICTRPADDGEMTGVIDPRDVDKFSICLFPGEALVVKTDAGACNNECDGVIFDPEFKLTYFDPLNQVEIDVAAADDIDDLDPAHKFIVTQHGQYILSVSDYTGGGSADDMYIMNATIFQADSTQVNDCGDEGPCLSFVGGLCPCNGFRNHGGYVTCIVRWAKQLKWDGQITNKEFSDLVSAAAASDCSQPDIHSGKGDHAGWDGTTKNNDIPKPVKP
ncbi:hypothetical protein ACFLU6_02565 [Acidobacteriota bacterium]